MENFLESSGMKAVIDREAAKRQQPRRGLMEVVRVEKHPLVKPSPGIIARIHLKDGTWYDLIQDGFGKANYEVSINFGFKGDVLYCLVPPSGKRFVITGSEQGVKRLQ